MRKERNISKAIDAFAENLSNFSVQVATGTRLLRQNVDYKPCVGAREFRDALEDMEQHASSLSESLTVLETLSLNSLSFEELLGHCVAVYQSNRSAILKLETHLADYGYQPEAGRDLEPEDPQSSNGYKVFETSRLMGSTGAPDLPAELDDVSSDELMAEDEHLDRRMTATASTAKHRSRVAAKSYSGSSEAVNQATSGVAAVGGVPSTSLGHRLGQGDEQPFQLGLRNAPTPQLVQSGAAFPTATVGGYKARSCLAATPDNDLELTPGMAALLKKYDNAEVQSDVSNYGDDLRHDACENDSGLNRDAVGQAGIGMGSQVAAAADSFSEDEGQGFGFAVAVKGGVHAAANGTPAIPINVSSVGGLNLASRFDQVGAGGASPDTDFSFSVSSGAGLLSASQPPQKAPGRGASHGVRINVNSDPSALLVPETALSPIIDSSKSTRFKLGGTAQPAAAAVTSTPFSITTASAVGDQAVPPLSASSYSLRRSLHHQLQQKQREHKMGEESPLTARSPFLSLAAADSRALATPLVRAGLTPGAAASGASRPFSSSLGNLGESSRLAATNMGKESNQVGAGLRSRVLEDALSNTSADEKLNSAAGRGDIGVVPSAPSTPMSTGKWLDYDRVLAGKMANLQALWVSSGQAALTPRRASPGDGPPHNGTAVEAANGAPDTSKMMNVTAASQGETHILGNVRDLLGKGGAGGVSASDTYGGKASLFPPSASSSLAALAAPSSASRNGIPQRVSGSGGAAVHTGGTPLSPSSAGLAARRHLSASASVSSPTASATHASSPQTPSSPASSSSSSAVQPRTGQARRSVVAVGAGSATRSAAQRSLVPSKRHAPSVAVLPFPSPPSMSHGAGGGSGSGRGASRVNSRPGTGGLTVSVEGSLPSSDSPDPVLSKTFKRMDLKPGPRGPMPLHEGAMGRAPFAGSAGSMTPSAGSAVAVAAASLTLKVGARALSPGTSQLLSRALGDSFADHLARPTASIIPNQIAPDPFQIGLAPSAMPPAFASPARTPPATASPVERRSSSLRTPPSAVAAVSAETTSATKDALIPSRIPMSPRSTSGYLPRPVSQAAVPGNGGLPESVPCMSRPASASGYPIAWSPASSAVAQFVQIATTASTEKAVDVSLVRLCTAEEWACLPPHTQRVMPLEVLNRHLSTAFASSRCGRSPGAPLGSADVPDVMDIDSAADQAPPSAAPVYFDVSDLENFGLQTSTSKVLINVLVKLGRCELVLLAGGGAAAVRTIGGSVLNLGTVYRLC